MQNSYEGLHHWRGKHGSYEVNHIDGEHGIIDIYLDPKSSEHPKDAEISVQICEENGIWRCKGLTVKSLQTKEARNFALGLFHHIDEMEAAGTIMPVIRELLK